MLWLSKAGYAEVVMVNVGCSAYENVGKPSECENDHYENRWYIPAVAADADMLLYR